MPDTESPDDNPNLHIASLLQKRFGLAEVSLDVIELLKQDPEKGIRQLLSNAGRELTKKRQKNITRVHVPWLRSQLSEVFKSSSKKIEKDDGAYVVEDFSEAVNPTLVLVPSKVDRSPSLDSQVRNWMFSHYNTAISKDQQTGFRTLLNIRAAGNSLPSENLRHSFGIAIQSLEQSLRQKLQSGASKLDLIVHIVRTMNIWMEQQSLFVVIKVKPIDGSQNELSMLTEQLVMSSTYRNGNEKVLVRYVHKAHPDLLKCGCTYSSDVDSVIIDLDYIAEEITKGEILLGKSGDHHQSISGSRKSLNLFQEYFGSLWKRHHDSQAVRKSLISRLTGEEVRHGFDIKRLGPGLLKPERCEDCIREILQEQSLPRRLIVDPGGLTINQQQIRKHAALEFAGKMTGASVCDPRDQIAEWRAYIRSFSYPQSSLREDIQISGKQTCTAHMINAKISILFLASEMGLIDTKMNQERILRHNDLVSICTKLENSDPIKLQDAIAKCGEALVHPLDKIPFRKI